MGVEWVAGLMVLFAIVALAGAAVVFFRDRSWFLQWLRGTAGFVLLAVSVYLSLLAGSLFAYQQSSDGLPLATVSFVANGPQAWDVTVTEANGTSRVFELNGDLWEMDVRLLRYSGIGSIFGTSPSFQVERLAGRYLSLEDQQNKDVTEYNLLDEPLFGFDIWERAQEGGSLFVTPTRSGLRLLPVVDGAIVEVILDEGGHLGVRQANASSGPEETAAQEEAPASAE